MAPLNVLKRLFNDLEKPSAWRIKYFGHKIWVTLLRNFSEGLFAALDIRDSYIADSYIADSYIADSYIADSYIADSYIADRPRSVRTVSVTIGRFQPKLDYAYRIYWKLISNLKKSSARLPSEGKQSRRSHVVDLRRVKDP